MILLKMEIVLKLFWLLQNPPKKLRNEIRYRILPFTDITKAMVGQFAGVRVITESGQSGIASDIRIRGTNSVNGSNAPVYVVD